MFHVLKIIIIFFRDDAPFRGKEILPRDKAALQEGFADGDIRIGNIDRFQPGIVREGPGSDVFHAERDIDRLKLEICELPVVDHHRPFRDHEGIVLRTDLLFRASE